MRASALATAWKNAASLAGSLRPGSASVPLALSTAKGRVARIASATLPGVKDHAKLTAFFRAVEQVDAKNAPPEPEPEPAPAAPGEAA